MATFYKQNDEGEYVEADNEVEDLFRHRSEKIIRSKLDGSREKYKTELRNEIEEEIRNSALETIKSEAKAELEAEYKDKLSASENKARELDIALRRKTIAAEYGFKPEAEGFLGDGSDDDMRAKADVLKTSFGVTNANGAIHIEKSTEPKVSKLQQKTGITVEI